MRIRTLSLKKKISRLEREENAYQRRVSLYEYHATNLQSQIQTSKKIISSMEKSLKAIKAIGGSGEC